MSTTEGTTEPEGQERNGAKARQLAGLAPPWPKGVSGNPSGLTRDGFPTKNNTVRTDIQQAMAQPQTRRRFIKAWIEDACNGDAKAREQILQRLDPVSTDDGRQGVVVFEGIKLELVARTSEAQPPAAPRDVEIEPASVALPELEESHGGANDQSISGSESPGERT